MSKDFAENLNREILQNYLNHHPEMNADQIINRLRITAQYVGLINHPLAAELTPSLKKLFEQQQQISSKTQHFLTPSYQAKHAVTSALHRRSS